MKRLTPILETIKRLCINSKNKCAFPDCDHPLLVDDKYVAELCHIEGALPGSARYNPQQSAEDRRSYENLLFLCHRHHKETDDVLKFSVDAMKRMKRQHEQLPEVFLKSELLLQGVEKVLARQEELSQKLGKIVGDLPNFPIIGPVLENAWTPEQGRFFTYEAPNGATASIMMKNGWLHIENKLANGAVAYYEVNEEGNVRDGHLAYPLAEYTIDIPADIILRQENIPATVGDRAFKTVLKWSKGNVVEHFDGGVRVGLDCHARCRIDNLGRRITVIG